MDHLCRAHDLEVIEGLPVRTQANRHAFPHQVHHVRPEAEDGIGFSVVSHLYVILLEDRRVLPLVNVGAVEQDQVRAEEADIGQVTGRPLSKTPAGVKMVPAVIQVVHHVAGAQLVSLLLDLLEQLSRAGVGCVNPDAAGDAVVRLCCGNA